MNRPFFCISVIIIFVCSAIEVAAESEKVLEYKGKNWQQIGSGQLLSWADANDYCRNLNVAGYSGWRLPTQEELQNLVVCTRAQPVATKPEDIVLGFDNSCKEDLKYGGGGRINPAFKLHMTKNQNVWQSRYWTATRSETPILMAKKSIALKSEKGQYGYAYVPFLGDQNWKNFFDPPAALNFVRCIQ